ncbi:MAG: 5-deoxy-glucuronate isomerase [Christensenellales bacterium]|jgi:5-deoxy-glucuronate isomerase
MIIRHQKEFDKGYNPLTFMDSPDDISCMDFGIIRLKEGDAYQNAEPKERAILLIQGHIVLEFEGNTQEIMRSCYLNENPVCIHLPKEKNVTITAKGISELAYQAVANPNAFEAKLITQQDCVTEEFGKNVMGETSLRRVRTVIDDSTAPYSNLVIGEVINFPGKWSSYPPHHHVQPEVYYFRFFPEQGFGFSCEGEEVYKVYDRDTVVFKGGLVHPQVAAPGYAMYYIWMIPHTPKRWRKDRVFLKQDEWLLSKDARIWPE